MFDSNINNRIFGEMDYTNKTLYDASVKSIFLFINRWKLVILKKI